MLLGLLLPVLLLRLIAAQDVGGLDNWPELSPTREYALRSQRDVAANVSLDQVVMVGTQLSTVLFAAQGYTSAALAALRQLLDVNVEAFVIDLYLDQSTGNFQLCPVAINTTDYSYGAVVELRGEDAAQYECEVGLAVEDLLAVFSTYIAGTDTNLAANLLLLLFNLKLLPNFALLNTAPSNNSLSYSLTNAFKDKLYTPTNLSSDRSNHLTYKFNYTLDSTTGFPDLSRLLFVEAKRVMCAIWDTSIPSNNTAFNSTGLSVTVFNKTTLQSSQISITEAVELTTEPQVINEAQENWTFVYDDNEHKFTNDTIRDMLESGYMPIINHTLTNFSDVGTLLNNSLWSWSPSEPLIEDEARQIYNPGGERNPQQAFRCATLSKEGQWEVSNCYDEYYVICRSVNDQFDWQLIKGKHTYFEASDACSDDNYFFTVPQSSLQQKSLTIYMKQQHVNESVWIDMNSIAVRNCWVNGGIYANCPYEPVTNKRNYIGMITPASAVFVCLTAGMFLLRLKTVPVQDNRKHWKKVINQYTANEYEGVPS